MNIKINDKEITLPEELLKQIEESMYEKEWPQNGDKYYLIEFGRVDSLSYEGEVVDTRLLLEGNFYKTEEEAENKLNELKAIQRVKDYIKKEFGVFEPDWGDHEEPKATLFYCHEEESIKDDECRFSQLYSPIGYLRSSEHAEQLIKDCNEDLLTIYK